MGAVMINFLLALSLGAAVAVVGWVAIEIERHLL
jgi:hypothetical protein